MLPHEAESAAAAAGAAAAVRSGSSSVRRRNSMRRAASALTRSFSARFSLTRQRAVASDQHQAAIGNSRQKSSESHDSTASGVSFVSGASSSSNTDFELFANARSGMDLLGVKKSEEREEEEKKDDASIRGLWRRAFHSLKTKDKSQRKKKGRSDDEDQADDVDPVYSLLKRAADKGSQKCTSCGGVTSGVTAAAAAAAAAGGGGAGEGGGGSSSVRRLDTQILMPGSSAQISAPAAAAENEAMFQCTCHEVEILPNVTVSDLRPKQKSKKRSRSFMAAERLLVGRDKDSQLLRKEGRGEAGSGAAAAEPVWGGRGRFASRDGAAVWHEQPMSLPEFGEGN